MKTVCSPKLFPSIHAKEFCWGFSLVPDLMLSWVILTYNNVTPHPFLTSSPRRCSLVRGLEGTQCKCFISICDSSDAVSDARILPELCWLRKRISIEGCITVPCLHIEVK